MKAITTLLVVTLIAVPTLRAQVVPDGASVTLANVTNSITGSVTVGTNGAFTLLTLSDNALLTNSAHGVIGRNATAKSNEVQLLSASARWLMSGSLFVGSNGALSTLLVSNGATVLAGGSGTLGHGGDFSSSANSNTVSVSGVGSLWSIGLELVVGELGFANRLEVNNGGRVLSSNAFVGRSHFSPSNSVVVTGAGSVWSNRADLSVGGTGAGNLLVVSNGGWVVSSNAIVGLNSSSLNNTVEVSGAGSRWSSLTDLTIGFDGSTNQFCVLAGGVASVGRNLLVGRTPVFANGNRLVVDGGTLAVTNGAANAALEIRRGTNVLTAGLIEADILRLTNGALGRIEVNGGTLAIRSSRVSIGNPVIIGNGVSPATLHLAGNGTHDMSGTLGLIITNNATLSGNGSLLVQLQVRPGATLRPGASIGKISVNTAPFLSGTTLMEISKSGTALTNDQFAVTGTLTYGGTLTVTHLGPTALAAGDRFPLFNATSYAGAFASITLPPLPAPLFWKNNLLTDGSIVVAAPPAIALSSGSYTQGFDSLSVSGGTNPWRDNSTLLGWYAAKSVAPTNITTYIASDGNGNAGALYSFGSSGSGERALGSIGSGSVDTISYGLGFTNDTGVSVSNFLVSYTGEQWRDSSSFNTNTLTFWYRVSPFALTNPEPGVVTNWTAHAGLDFASPTVTGAGVGINGNTPANRRVFASVPVPGLTVPPGHCVFFRWQDPDDPGTDEGIAVDDLTVTFSPSARDFGVDVSHFQNESGVPQSSWDQMFAEGKRFAFIKATEGLTGPHDPTMSNNVTRATAAGLLAGVYHFAHPENRPTTNGAVLEASNFVIYAGSAIGPGRVRPVLDLERGANLTTTELTDWVIAFCNEIIARRGAGAAPIIYCSQTFANNELDSRLAGYDLWLRTVNSGADPAVDQPPAQLGFSTATGVFTNWSFWQYSSTGNSGGLSPLDLNVCHSEFKPLSSFLIPPSPTAPMIQAPMFTGGAFQLTFTSTPGARFTVLAAPDPILPLHQWMELGPAAEIAPGQFQFMDVQTTNHARRFYLLRSP